MTELLVVPFLMFGFLLVAPIAAAIGWAVCGLLTAIALAAAICSALWLSRGR